MITDDPDTPGDKHWEVNVADIGNFSRTDSLNQVPYIDLNYGWGDRIQLKMEGGYTILKSAGNSAQSGVGPMLVGVKWRFIDQEKDGVLSISTYPQFSFHPGYSSKNPDIAASGNYWLLPLEFSKRWGPIAINPEIGYQYNTQVNPEIGDQFNTQSRDSWFYGVVGAYEPVRNFELLAELHGDVMVQRGASDLLFNLGFRYPFTKHILLIASAGHTIRTLPGIEAQWLTYFGLQFRL